MTSSAQITLSDDERTILIRALSRHHDDYSKPLDVRWLCPPHHREHHAKAEGAQ